MPDDLKMNNVLVVDDSPTMRRMVITSLGSLGRVKSTQAGSGLEAIERLAVEETRAFGEFPYFPVE